MKITIEKSHAMNDHEPEKKIDGVSFIDAEKNVVSGKYGNVIVKFIGKNELIVNKNQQKD